MSVFSCPKKVTFLENHKEALYVLKKNILTLDFQKKCKIIEKNCFDFFNKKKFEEKFNIIFMDPPYKEENINLIIDFIIEEKVLDNNGILIIHRHKKDNVCISNKLKIIEERSYGISKIFIGN